MNEVIDALLDLCEPSESVAVDRALAQPFDFEANTLYGWPMLHTQTIAGTGEAGAPGELREDFSIRLVYVADSGGEEAAQKRSRAVSDALDAKAAKYLQAISRHTALTIDNVVMWESLQGTVDHDFVRQLELRGISVVATGWRFISG